MHCMLTGYSELLYPFLIRGPKCFVLHIIQMLLEYKLNLLVYISAVAAPSYLNAS